VVQTFELVSGNLSLLGSHPSLGEASSALPQGSYTTLRTYAGDRVLRLEQHVRRLEESLHGAAPLDVAEVRRALALALERNGYRESRLRLTYASPRLFVSAEPFEPLPETSYRKGARCVTVALQRENPHAKHTGFIATAARTYARLAPGVDEALMVAQDGSILEGLSSNFFAVCKGALHTEDARVLPGVTRAIVLELAAGLLPLRTQAVRKDQLDSVSECFVTSVSREILPVVEIDGSNVGDGKPGRETRELMRRFAELVEKEANSVRD
jgi:branched-chain amino acid aminotransferase